MLPLSSSIALAHRVLLAVHYRAKEPCVPHAAPRAPPGDATIDPRQLSVLSAKVMLVLQKREKPVKDNVRVLGVAADADPAALCSAFAPSDAFC
jgi:hypothetical protein